METERTDGRLKRELSVDRRTDRGLDDRRVSENREVSDAERLEMFRMQMYQSALPDLPNIPGYHVCWLTTENSKDPIFRRQQMGYEPVMGSDVPGLEYATIKTGEYAGMIGVNEMLAFKLPEHLYQMYMREAHYDAPMAEQEKIAANMDLMKGNAAAQSSQLYEDEGFEEVRQKVAPPEFFS